MKKLLILTLPLFACAMQAQANDQSATMIAAPAQLQAAKTVFISNLLEASSKDQSDEFGMFYRAVSKSSRFSIVNDPTKADLIVELSQRPEFYAEGNIIVGGTHYTIHVIDPHSHIALGSASEYSAQALLQSSRDKNLNTAITTLAADLETLGKPTKANNAEGIQ